MKIPKMVAVVAILAAATATSIVPAYADELPTTTPSVAASVQTSPAADPKSSIAPTTAPTTSTPVAPPAPTAPSVPTTAAPGTVKSTAPTATPTPSPSPESDTKSAAAEPPSGAAAVGAGEAAIQAHWTSLGGASGSLGPVASTVYCELRNSGCVQRFEKGAIHWSEATGAHATQADIAAKWATLNWESGRLGYPVSEQVCTLKNGGCVQRFEGGAVHWSKTTGAFATWAAIAARWAALNWEAGRLGYPVSDEICGLRNGGCVQRFEGGAVHWSNGTGAHATWAAIAARWATMNWESGRMGYPISGETCGLRNDGCVQRFEGGVFYWSPFGGAQPMWGAILASYGGRSWESGSLGYPVAAESCSGSTVCSQEFQYGKFTWTAGLGVKYHLRSAGYCESLNRNAVRYTGGGSARVSFAIAESYPATPVTFTTCVRVNGAYQVEWTVPGYAGESGFARPGVASGPTINKFSPTGSFTVTEAFGLGNPGTSLSYRQLNAYSRWGGRLNSNYNKYFESSADIFPDENMWYYATRPSHDYRQGVVINYNRPPDSAIQMNAGFAIFLHANRVPTWGCISLSEADVVRFQQGAVPGDRIIMGVGDDVFS
ncbi:hypothetical protein [Arthrobacter sp. EPSL27]|uniref:hypothetical protein n=1 Tax=Arthrobacter sp. EPSL27 TaxID=1745378 RepID=UPI0012F9CC7D|nr:hypothetical protein [Arthrobacter sp. EPSL27]